MDAGVVGESEQSEVVSFLCLAEGQPSECEARPEANDERSESLDLPSSAASRLRLYPLRAKRAGFACIGPKAPSTSARARSRLRLDVSATNAIAEEPDSFVRTCRMYYHSSTASRLRLYCSPSEASQLRWYWAKGPSTSARARSRLRLCSSLSEASQLRW